MVYIRYFGKYYVFGRITYSVELIYIDNEYEMKIVTNSNLDDMSEIISEKHNKKLFDSKTISFLFENKSKKFIKMTSTLNSVLLITTSSIVHICPSEYT